MEIGGTRRLTSRYEDIKRDILISKTGKEGNGRHVLPRYRRKIAPIASKGLADAEMRGRPFPFGVDRNSFEMK